MVQYHCSPGIREKKILSVHLMDKIFLLFFPDILVKFDSVINGGFLVTIWCSPQGAEDSLLS